MKIGVLLKQTPDTETKIQIKADKSGIEESGIKWVVNPYDEYAIEEALRLKEAWGGGEVVVVTVGSRRGVEAMRQGLAMGADRGIRIDCPDGSLDSFQIATALATAVKEENFDVLFAGKQGVDDDAVMVAHGVATALEIPCVWPVLQIEKSGDKQVRATRAVAGGKKEILEVNLPAVLCCDKGENDPRYASLPGIMKAKSKPIAEKKAADLLQGETAKVRYSRFDLPPERGSVKMIGGDAVSQAAMLVKLLREEAKVL